MTKKAAKPKVVTLEAFELNAEQISDLVSRQRLIKSARMAWDRFVAASLPSDAGESYDLPDDRTAEVVKLQRAVERMETEYINHVASIADGADIKAEGQDATHYYCQSSFAFLPRVAVPQHVADYKFNPSTMSFDRQ